MKRLIGLSIVMAALMVVASPLLAEDGELVQREKARLAELTKLAEQIEVVVHELREGVERAAKEGKRDLAHSMEQRVNETRRKLEEVIHQIKRQKGRVELAAHMQELIREMHERREAGNEEGVSEMADKIAHIRRELSEPAHVERRPEHPPERRPDVPRGEGIEIRMKKVMEASELIGRSAQLLREAGVGPEAVGQLQQLSHGLREQVQRWQQAMRENAERERGQAELREQLEKKERELMELRRRMEEMQRHRSESDRVPEGFIRRDVDRPRESDRPRETDRER